MAQIQIKNLSFSYPNAEQSSLKNIQLMVEQGEFITVIGQSGCGKSTLLRQLKRALRPHGVRQGNVLFGNIDLDDVTDEVAATDIGYVLQQPENQIVTDKVWHELAFGLESLGMDTEKIRLKVAEIANYFGIHSWFHKKTAQLSGGQKQLLNLASIMVMEPKVLLLDEPTSQLDPIAALEFLQTLKRLNEELGLTVIIVEHRLEDVLPMSERVLVMDNGTILYDGAPKKMLQTLEPKHPMISALPTAAKIFHALGGRGDSPFTIKEGQQWLKHYVTQHHIVAEKSERQTGVHNECAIEVKDVAFRYEKSGPDILAHFNVAVNKGEIYSIIGGNGSGKSTALAVLAGLQKPYRGNVTIFGQPLKKVRAQTVILLPQDPKALFVEKTVLKELSFLKGQALFSEQKLQKMIDQFHLQHLLERHPYDCSGGEQQRIALAKVLLLEPSILLLDEPTKGLDAFAKEELGQYLQQLQQQGMTIVLVTHDIEFSANYSHRCALFFDRGIVAQGSPQEFYSTNTFYTTAAYRMSRGILEQAITYEDVLAQCQMVSVK